MDSSENKLMNINLDKLYIFIVSKYKLLAHFISNEKLLHFAEFFVDCLLKMHIDIEVKII